MAKDNETPAPAPAPAPATATAAAPAAEKTEEQLQAERVIESQLNDDIEQQTLKGGFIQAEAVPANNDKAVTSLAGFLNYLGLGLNFAGFKNMGAVWSDEEQNLKLAQVTIPVLEKHAWGSPILKFLAGDVPQEELALIMVLAPIGLVSYKAYNSDMAAKQAEKEAETTAPEAENNAANPVTDTVQHQSV